MSQRRRDMDSVLTVKKLTMDFGGLRALNSVDLQVGKEEIVALIGPNGAGKTTFFNCVTGIHGPTEGISPSRHREAKSVGSTASVSTKSRKWEWPGHFRTSVFSPI
jgi:ABC-type branched-subunit amino acid transport system ATPase component